MTTIARILKRESIFLDIDLSSKKRLFEQIASHVEALNGVSRQAIFSGLNLRERLGSTALGEGVAIPHARTPGLDEAVGVFVRPRNPIEFDAPDERPVTLIFALLVPEAANQSHLEVLSQLAEIFSDAKRRTALQNADQAEAILACLSNPAGR